MRNSGIMDNFTGLSVSLFKLLIVNCLVIYSSCFEVTLRDFIAFRVSEQESFNLTPIHGST